MMIGIEKDIFNIESFYYTLILLRTVSLRNPISAFRSYNRSYKKRSRFFPVHSVLCPKRMCTLEHTPYMWLSPFP